MKLTLSIACLLGLLAPIGALGDEAPKPRPNVLVILCDDMRWDAPGYTGNPHVKTPHIDRLAAEGVNFANAFCTTSLCSPSRGVDPQRALRPRARRHEQLHRVPGRPAELPAQRSRTRATRRPTSASTTWARRTTRSGPGSTTSSPTRARGSTTTPSSTSTASGRWCQGYYTHVVTDMAVDWLKRPRERQALAAHARPQGPPQLLHARGEVRPRLRRRRHPATPPPRSSSTTSPTGSGSGSTPGTASTARSSTGARTSPTTAPEAVKDFAAMTRAYWGTILSVDDSVGRLRETLEHLGQLDNTIIVFLGDNGLLNGEHGMVDKRTMHEPSIRIPLVVRYPGLTPADRPKRIDAHGPDRGPRPQHPRHLRRPAAAQHPRPFLEEAASPRATPTGATRSSTSTTTRSSSPTRPTSAACAPTTGPTCTTRTATAGPTATRPSSTTWTTTPRSATT